MSAEYFEEQRRQLIAAIRANTDQVAAQIGKTALDERVLGAMAKVPRHEFVPGGRLVMPLGPAHALQQLTVIEKIAPSETRMRSIILVQFVPFTRSHD
jgi:protein-L-isoaspartate O-methyltransferase